MKQKVFVQKASLPRYSWNLALKFSWGCCTDLIMEAYPDEMLEMRSKIREMLSEKWNEWGMKDLRVF